MEQTAVGDYVFEDWPFDQIPWDRVRYAHSTGALTLEKALADVRCAIKNQHLTVIRYNDSAIGLANEEAEMLVALRSQNNYVPGTASSTREGTLAEGACTWWYKQNRILIEEEEGFSAQSNIYADYKTIFGPVELKSRRLSRYILGTSIPYFQYNKNGLKRLMDRYPKTLLIQFCLDFPDTKTLVFSPLLRAYDFETDPLWGTFESANGPWKHSHVTPLAVFSARFFGVKLSSLTKVMNNLRIIKGFHCGL